MKIKSFSFVRRLDKYTSLATGMAITESVFYLRLERQDSSFKAPCVLILLASKINAVSVIRAESSLNVSYQV